MVTVSKMLLLSPMHACFDLCRAARGHTRAVNYLHLHGCFMIVSNSPAQKFEVHCDAMREYLFKWILLDITLYCVDCGCDVDVDHYSAQYLSRSS